MTKTEMNLIAAVTTHIGCTSEQAAEAVKSARITAKMMGMSVSGVLRQLGFIA